jgi:cell division protein FtsB
MKNLLDRIPGFTKNFYFLSTLFFLFWLSFIDSNDLFLQKELSAKRSELTNAKEFYEEKILEVKNDREALLNNPELLEKIAREKYLMKKENEDLYIIVD